MAEVYSAGDFRNGTTFEMDGNVFKVVEFQHVKPGKGSAFVTSNSTNIGGSTANTFPLYDKIFISIFSFINFNASPICSTFNGICSSTTNVC